jgi:hypothetical protein
MTINLPPGCTQAQIDRAFGDDEDRYESEFFCEACCDLGWLPCGTFVLPCTECSAEFTLHDFDQAYPEQSAC